MRYFNCFELEPFIGSVSYFPADTGGDGETLTLK